MWHIGLWHQFAWRTSPRTPSFPRRCRASGRTGRTAPRAALPMRSWLTAAPSWQPPASRRRSMPRGRTRRRRARACPRRAVRPGDGPQPQHRAAGKSVRSKQAVGATGDGLMTNAIYPMGTLQISHYWGARRRLTNPCARIQESYFSRVPARSFGVMHIFHRNNIFRLLILQLH